MKFKLCLVLIVTTLFNCTNPNTTLYVGTYTKGDSEGIYKLNFNSKTGELTKKQLAVAVENPSFITFSPNKKYIYAVGEGTTSAITSFKIKDDKTLEFINTESSNGKGPCHVSTNKSGDKVVVSNYGGGTVSIHQINQDGSLNKASQIFNHNTENKKSHAHSALFFKNDLFVSDLGRNALYNYQLENNSYKLKDSSIVELPKNAGPRHFSLTKDGSFIYIINEYDSSITSVKKTDSSFKQIDYDSTLNEDYKGNNSCADIHLSKDERFLYGSNRGENSIAVFKRDIKTGQLDVIQNISVNGDWPRNFSLDPTGGFLLVANQRSENISVFKIDSKTGKLTFLHAIDLPSPVCLLF